MYTSGGRGGGNCCKSQSLGEGVMVKIGRGGGCVEGEKGLLGSGQLFNVLG